MDRIIHIFSIIMFIYVLLFSILNIVRGEENVALGKTTSQSSTSSSGFSSLAADGNTDNVYEEGSCSHTEDIGTNWWCVDLQRAVDFQKINIYNRNLLQERLTGFEIRFGSNGECNNNGYQQSTVCYKDISTKPQNIYTIEQCNQPNTGQFNGRSVYISLENKYLTLCEVEIYEKCPGNCKGGCNTKGVCNSCNNGDKCSTPCPNCNNGCRQDNGYCNSGGCISGYYGDKCSTPCPNCNNGCRQDNGYCNSGGCISGYYGNTCSTACPTNCNGLCVESTGDCVACKDGHWGAQCSKQCPTNCRQSKCNKNDGHCTSCKNQYWGEKCNKECSTNCKYNHVTTCYKNSGRCNCTETWYGELCNNKCSSNCKNSRCDQPQFGLICTDGCKDGYKGRYCQDTCLDNCISCNDNQCTSCKTGSYGDTCQSKCNGHCISGCDQFKGDCVNDKLDLGSQDGISQLGSGIIGALSLIVIILLMVIFYGLYKRRIGRNKSNERPVRYTSDNEETVTTPLNEVTEPPYYSNLPHDIPSSPYYNLQQVVDTSRVEDKAYESLDSTVPTPTYETLK